jgi:flagellum-specific peptidoglycan hydrolase FlgJ
MPETLTSTLGQPQTTAGGFERPERPVGQPSTPAARRGIRGGGSETAHVQHIEESPTGSNTTLSSQPVGFLGQVGEYLLSSPYGPEVPEIPLPVTKADIQATKDALQRHSRSVMAGTLVTVTLVNSGPALSTASAEPAGRTGDKVAHSKTARRTVQKPQDQVIPLPRGGAIYNIAVPIAKRRGVNPNTETHEIEQASGVYSEAQAEDLQPGFKLHIPVTGTPEYIREPLGSNLSTTAAENGLTLTQFLDLNPKYWSHPDVVQAGALLRVSGNTLSDKTVHSATTHHKTVHKSHAPTHSNPKPHVAKPSHLESKPLEQKQTLPAPSTHAARQKAAAPKAAARKHVTVPKAPIQPAIKLTSPIFPPVHLTPFHASSTHPAAKASSVPKHSNHHEHAPAISQHEAGHIKTDYDIHSDVLGKSGLSVEALQHALEQMYGSPMAELAQDFHKLEQKSGINALYIAAAAAQESAGAKSKLAVEKNNLFGINAVDANPNAAFDYKTKAENIKAFVDLIINKYAYPGGQYYNGSSLHGIYTDYSSSHDKEAEEIASIMNSLAGYAKNLNHVSQSNTHTGHRHKPAGRPGLFHVLGHAWGEAGSTVTSTLSKPVKKTWEEAQLAAIAMPGHWSHHSHTKPKHHVAVNGVIYKEALKFTDASYPPTSELAMSAGHQNNLKTWLERYGYRVGPKALLDCSGLVRISYYMATNGRDEGNENTTTERTGKVWMKIPFSKLGQGDIDQPAAYHGDHVEIVNKVKGNTIYTFGAHTSRAPQPDQVGPAKYMHKPGDLYLRYVGPGAPLGNYIRSQSGSWTNPNHGKQFLKPKTHVPAKSAPKTLRQQAGW